MFSITYVPNVCGNLNGLPLNSTSKNPHVGAVSADGYPISPFSAMIACRTPRLVASPAAQLLREPVFGAWR